MFLPHPIPQLWHYCTQHSRQDGSLCRNAHTRNSTDQQNLETLLAENAQTQTLPCPTPSVAPPLCGRAQAGANRFSGLTETQFYPILSTPRLPRRDSNRHIIGVSGGPPAYNRCRSCLRQANNQWRDAGAGSG